VTCACTRRDYCRVGVPAEHGHVRSVEIDVAESVDVGEAGPVTAVDVDGLIVVRGHPRHRQAVRHVRAGPVEQRKRTRSALPESGQLTGVQVADFYAIEIT
jgi:hypothetical protein